MSKRIFLIITWLCWGISFNIYAQDTGKADRWFERGAYYRALEEYCRLLSNQEENRLGGYMEFRAGVCCMRMNRYRHALEWLEKAEKDNFTGPEVWEELGNGYWVTGQYEKAKVYFERCLQKKPEDEVLRIRVASCNFALKAPREHPRIRIAPLPYLNTRGSEYGISFVPGGLLYSSTGDLLPEKKQEISLRTGLGYSRPYLSWYKEGEYQPGQLLKGIVKFGANEGAFAYDAESESLYCTRCEEGEQNCRILVARLKNGTYRQTGVLKLGKEDCNIAHPFVAEGGDRIYFSSTRPGGFGGSDIWYVDRLSEHVWGEPQNAGSHINTPGNEVFPYMWKDYFFFASDGYAGYGGLDIYRVKMQDGQLGMPTNMGPGINTSYDDFNLVMNEDGKSGLLVSNRLPDRSDDIYWFEEVEEMEDIPRQRGGTEKVVFVSQMLEAEPEEIELKDTIRQGNKIYRMKVEKGEVKQAGWWVQVAMLLSSDVIEYEFANQITELTGQQVVMYKGKDGGHRFYIGVYEKEQEARDAVSILRKAGIDCFVKQVR